MEQKYSDCVRYIDKHVAVQPTRVKSCNCVLSSISFLNTITLKVCTSLVVLDLCVCVLSNGLVSHLGL